MQKKVRANVLRLPQGIRPESVMKAQSVLEVLSKHLRTLGSPTKAAEATAAETGTRVETRMPFVTPAGEPSTRTEPRTPKSTPPTTT